MCFQGLQFTCWSLQKLMMMQCIQTAIYTLTCEWTLLNTVVLISEKTCIRLYLFYTVFLCFYIALKVVYMGRQILNHLSMGFLQYYSVRVVHRTLSHQSSSFPVWLSLPTACHWASSVSMKPTQVLKLLTILTCWPFHTHTHSLTTGGLSVTPSSHSR